MDEAATMAERHGRMLAELSELLMASARDLAARQLQAEDTAVAAEGPKRRFPVLRRRQSSLGLDPRFRGDERRNRRDPRPPLAQLRLTPVIPESRASG